MNTAKSEGEYGQDDLIQTEEEEEPSIGEAAQGASWAKSRGCTRMSSTTPTASYVTPS